MQEAFSLGKREKVRKEGTSKEPTSRYRTAAVATLDYTPQP